MTPDELLSVTLRRMAELADPEFKAGMEWFFKESVDAYGIRSAKVHSLANELYRDLKKFPAAQRNRFCAGLWKTGKIENGALVCYLYRRFHKDCAEAEFALFEQWMDRYVRNWAHCDGVASWLLAASIANRPALIANLSGWTQSKNRWKRRAAVVALLQEAKAGRNTDAIFRIAESLLDDPDDMVQKGVGWVLKETYPKKPREVVSFLQPFRATVPRLLLRYAAEKMTPEDRNRVLGYRPRDAASK